MVQAGGMMLPGPGTGAAAPGHSGVELPGRAPGSDTLTISIFQSLEQLGLKLETRKAPMEMIVIDHLEKSPTAQ